MLLLDWLRCPGTVWKGRDRASFVSKVPLPLREAVSVRCKVEVEVGSPERDVPPLREAVSAEHKVEVGVGSPERDVPPLQRAASARRKVEVETRRAFGVRPGE